MKGELPTIAHYWRTQRSERRFLHDHQEELEAQSQGLPQTTAALQAHLSKERPSTQNIYPRPSLELIHSCFRDIQQTRFYSDRLAEDKTTRALQLMGDFLLPQAGVQLPDHPTPGTIGEDNSSSCSDAELYFGDALKQVDEETYELQSRVSVYHDSAGTPLALRKNHLSPSALLLQPVGLESLTVPPGTIVGIDRTMNQHPTGKQSHTDRGLLFSLETYQVDEEFKILPLRLSAWAYDRKIDRALFAVEQGYWLPNYDAERAALVTAHQLSDFQAAADKILSLCDVICA